MRKKPQIIILSLVISIILWISIRLSQDYYTTYNFPLKLTDFQKGYSSGTYIPNNVTVKLKGQGWQLFKLGLGSMNSYNINVGKGIGEKLITPSNYLGENQWLGSNLDVINIQPKNIDIRIEKTINKKLKIIPQLELDFKSGYGLATPIKIFPDTIEVVGPRSYLSKMNILTTEKVVLKNLDKKNGLKINLLFIQGMEYSNNQIELNLDVQQIVEKVFDNIPINIINVPKNYEVLLIPNKISINVRGGIDVLGKLTSKNFNAFVNYKNINIRDTLKNIKPEIIHPKNVTLLQTISEKVKYIIKRY